MNEMASIENINPESYNAFQTKYNALYFPQYKDDAGFYMPIKDQNLTYFANKNCKVRIADEDVNLRDVLSYKDLQVSGEAYYSLRSESNEMELQMGSLPEIFVSYKPHLHHVGPEYSSGWQVIGKRKVCFKARRWLRDDSYTLTPNPFVPDQKVKFTQSTSFTHYEFCFRKKTWIGWVNYSSPSDIKILHKYDGEKDWSTSLFYHHNEYSSHDDDEKTSYSQYEQGTVPADSRYYKVGEHYVASVKIRAIDHELNYSWSFPKVTITNCLVKIN